MRNKSPNFTVPRSRLVRSERGVTLLEFTIVGPICLLILLLSIDMLRITYDSLTLQFIVTRVMRVAQVGPDARPIEYASQEEWIQGEIIALGNGLGVRVRPEHVSICPYSQVLSGTGCDSAVLDAGLPGELVAVRVNRPTRGLVWWSQYRLGRRDYGLAAVVVSRNERWSD